MSISRTEEVAMAELMWIVIAGGLVLLTLAYVRLCEGL